jgi:hypothetical protein
MDRRIHAAPVMALAIAATLLLATVAQAQGTSAKRATATARTASPNERTKGLMFGVHTIAAPGVTVDVPEFETQFKSGFGPGAGLMIGYGFNQTFSSYVSLDVAKQGAQGEDISGTYGLGHFEIGVRANFPNVKIGSSGKTIPYVMGSFGQRALGARVTDLESEETADLSFRGSVIGLGAGIEHALSPNLSFDGGLQLGFGSFNTFSFDHDEMDISSGGTTSIRLRLGLTWRPRT